MSDISLVLDSDPSDDDDDDDDISVDSTILLYYKMLAFNNVLSSQRITIERAFGILILNLGNIVEADCIRS